MDDIDLCTREPRGDVVGFECVVREQPFDREDLTDDVRRKDRATLNSRARRSIARNGFDSYQEKMWSATNYVYGNARWPDNPTVLSFGASEPLPIRSRSSEPEASS